MQHVGVSMAPILARKLIAPCPTLRTFWCLSRCGISRHVFYRFPFGGLSSCWVFAIKWRELFGRRALFMFTSGMPKGSDQNRIWHQFTSCTHLIPPDLTDLVFEISVHIHSKPFISLLPSNYLLSSPAHRSVKPRPCIQRENFPLKKSREADLSKSSQVKRNSHVSGGQGGKKQRVNNVYKGGCLFHSKRPWLSYSDFVSVLLTDQKENYPSSCSMRGRKREK